jgi:hypothetical protein
MLPTMTPPTTAEKSIVGVVWEALLLLLSLELSGMALVSDDEQDVIGTLLTMANSMR